MSKDFGSGSHECFNSGQLRSSSLSLEVAVLWPRMPHTGLSLSSSTYIQVAFDRISGCVMKGLYYTDSKLAM